MIMVTIIPMVITTIIITITDMTTIIIMTMDMTTIIIMTMDMTTTMDISPARVPGR
jgi:hypothetical protein